MHAIFSQHGQLSVLTKRTKGALLALSATNMLHATHSTIPSTPDPRSSLGLFMEQRMVSICFISDISASIVCIDLSSMEDIQYLDVAPALG